MFTLKEGSLADHTESTHPGAFVLEPADNLRLANLCGQFDEHLRMIEKRLGVEINNRGAVFDINGPDDLQRKTKALLQDVYRHAAKEVITPVQIHLFLQESGLEDCVEGDAQAPQEVLIRTRRSRIRGRGQHQKQYLKNIQENDINFGIGPAGTGKTYLAVASAIDALERNLVSRLVLTRPAVEAG